MQKNLNKSKMKIKIFFILINIGRFSFSILVKEINDNSSAFLSKLEHLLIAFSATKLWTSISTRTFERAYSGINVSAQFYTLRRYIVASIHRRIEASIYSVHNQLDIIFKHLQHVRDDAK